MEAGKAGLCHDPRASGKANHCPVRNERMTIRPCPPVGAAQSATWTCGACYTPRGMTYHCLCLHHLVTLLAVNRPLPDIPVFSPGATLPGTTRG